MSRHVAVIGAGVAGLAAARCLRHAGVACTVFDKSRGVGGRMATRRAGDFSFDHGVQYFRAGSDRFGGVVAQWRGSGCVAEWFDGAFVGAPMMTAPARALAEGCRLVLDCEVKSVSRGARGWTVFTGESTPAADGNGTFDAVLFALPAPQIRPLVASAGVRFDVLATARYSPCWALMLAFPKLLKTRWTHLRLDGGDIAWIARNATKPMRNSEQETFVVHAGAGWSARHLECAPRAALTGLLPLFRSLTSIREAPVFASAHRWRYALVQEPVGAPCLWDNSARIGACGDWCLGPHVEAAFDSGEAMARTYLESSYAR